MTTYKLSAQRGVGLIEVLVAVLILSIGLLGLAGLQMRTLRDNQSALDRSIAVVETHAIADAMRADRAVAEAGRYDIAMGAAAPTGATFRDTVLAEWLDNLESSLGTGAQGSVDCNGPSCLIIIQWDDSRASAGANDQTLTTQVYL